MQIQIYELPDLQVFSSCYTKFRESADNKKYISQQILRENSFLFWCRMYASKVIDVS